MGQPCPNESTLLSYHLGRLPEVEIVAITNHLEKCPICNNVLDGLEQKDDGIYAALRGQDTLVKGSSRTADPGPLMLPVSVPGYEILGELGRGGMGVVYKARHRQLGRLVALKMLLGGEFAQDDYRERFRAEAEAVARLQHPGIVQIFDVGEWQADPTSPPFPYFTLEYVAGGSLSDRLAGKPQNPVLSAGWLETLSRTVHYAHGQGVIHRDLKPSNVLLTTDGQLKLCDFGVARLLTGSDVHTLSGQVVGTPEYMAPEQAQGRRDETGPATDVYALGTMLYTMLTGRPPFQGESVAATLLHICAQEPVPPSRLQPDVPRDLESICLKCLEKEPWRRYGSAGELAEDLRRFLDGRPTLARPVGAIRRLTIWARKRPAIAALTATLVTVVLIGLGLVVWQWNEALRQRTRADDRTKTAHFQTYRARLAAAIAALQGHDVSDAEHQLDLAPEDLRSWEWHHLYSRLDESSRVLRPPDGEHYDLPLAREEPRIVSSSRTDLRVLDLDGNLRASFPLARFPGLVGAHLARGGLAILTRDGHQIMRLHDESGKVLLCAEAPQAKDPRITAVSPDRSRMANFWWRENQPCPFDLFGPASSKAYARCAGHTDFIYSLSFSQNGTRILSASEDATARVWDARTGANILELRGHALKVYHAAFSPDETRIVTASADGTVRQWDSRTGEEVEPLFDGHAGEVLRAVYSPDGRRIASAGTDRTVRLWQATRRQGAVVLLGHSAPVTQLAFAADGRRLASSSGRGMIRLWETGPEMSLPVLRGHGSYVYPVAFSPDGQWIASGSWDKTVRLWDAATGEPCATFSHRDVVRTMAFSPDSGRLVSGCDNEPSLYVWNVWSGRIEKKIKGPGSSLNAVSFHPDGKRIAALDRSGKLSLIDTESGHELASTVTSALAVRGTLAFSPDGRWLAGKGEDDQTIRLWNAQTLAYSASLGGHTAAVYSVSFSSDGRWLVSASADRSVRVWNVSTGGCTAVLSGHTDEVFSAVFHPEGTRIASAGRDRVIWLWDVATGQEVARLTGHANYVFSLAFSPDGTTLVSGSGDGTVRLWDNFPLADRFAARREAESLRPEAKRLVERLLGENKDRARVVAALREDRSLSDALRHAALRVVLEP
jgi:WD40 repeat protein/tRNA A-37 threonylcarbamoyl transferase component Bud32